MRVVESCLGAGRCAVLIHGFPDSWWSWRNLVVHLLARGVDVRALDLPGFGGSELARRPEEVNVLRRVLPELRAYVEAQRPRKVVLIGHDVGALMAWMLAAETPVEGLLVFTVGHPGAALRPDRPPLEYLRSWHWGLCALPRPAPELLLRARDWRVFRGIVGHHPEADTWIRDLQRPGALTSALHWFRGNRLDFLRLPDFAGPGCPTVAALSLGDLRYVSRRSMLESERFVRPHPFIFYELPNLTHWPMLDAPEDAAYLVDRLLEFT